MGLTTGQLVRVRMADTSDDWCLAAVSVASNSEPVQSIALTLYDMVRAVDGVIGGVLPLTIDYEKQTVTSLFGDEYELETAEKYSSHEHIDS